MRSVVRFGPPVVAVVPIGAYAPRYFMKPQHADPEEAVTIARDCGAKHALGIHWGTFHFSDESIDEPGKRFSAALATTEAKVSVWEASCTRRYMGLRRTTQRPCRESPNSLPVSARLLEETASIRTYRAIPSRLAFRRRSGQAFSTDAKQAESLIEPFGSTRLLQVVVKTG